MNRHYAPLITSLFLVLLGLSGCMKKSSSYEGYVPSEQNGGGGGGGNNPGGPNQIGQNNSALDNALAEQQRCATNMAPVLAMTAACLPVVQGANSSEGAQIISAGCISAMGSLAAASCLNLTERYNSTVSACQANLNTYISMIPNPCRDLAAVFFAPR